MTTLFYTCGYRKFYKEKITNLINCDNLMPTVRLSDKLIKMLRDKFPELKNENNGVLVRVAIEKLFMVNGDGEGRKES